MLANFFKKSKPEVIFTIVACLFIYFTLANFLFRINEISWVYFFKNLVVFLAFSLFLFLVKFIISKNNLTQNNSFALLIVVLMLGVFYESFFNNSILFANVILLFSFRKIYSLRSGINTKLKLFDAGFWIGISTLIYVWSLLYILLIYFAILIFQKITFKNLIIPLIGFIFPIFIVFTYYFYVNNLESFMQIFLVELNFDYVSYNSFKLLIPIAFLITMALWSVVTVTPKIISSGTKYRKLWNLIVIQLIISAVVIAFSPIKNGSEMLFMMFPLAIIIANFLEKSKSKNFKNLIFYLFFIISISVYFL